MIFKTRTPPSEWRGESRAPLRGHGLRTVFVPSLPLQPLSRVPAPLSHSGHYITLILECDSWAAAVLGWPRFIADSGTLEGRGGLTCLASGGSQLSFSPSLLPRDPRGPSK